MDTSLKKIFSIVSTILILVGVSSAQKGQLDSLKNVLKEAPEDTNKVHLLNKISAMNEDIDPKESVRYAEEAIALSNKLDFKRGYANAYILIANNSDNQGDFQKSIEQYTEALNTYKKISDKQGIGRCYGNLGIVHQHQGNYSEAIEYLEQSLLIFEGMQNQTKIAVVFTNIGVVYLQQGKYPEAADYFLKSARIREEIGDKMEIGISYSSLSAIYYGYLKDIDRAKEYAFKAMKICNEIDNKRGLAFLHNNLGSIYQSEDSITKAIDHFTLAFKYHKELGNKGGENTVLSNIGDLEGKRGNYEKAREHYNKALEINIEIGNKLGIASNHRGIANIEIERNNYAEALTHCEKGMEIAQELKSRNIIARFYGLLSSIHEKQGNYQKSLGYFKKQAQLNDSIFNADNSEQIAEMQTRFETEKKEKENEILKKENEIQELAGAKKDVLVASFLGGIILMIAVAIAIYSRYRSKMASNEKLRAKNTLIRKQNKNIIDSINYARRIQSAILPEDSDMENILTEHFVFYRPRNIVSGDFYWFSHLKGKTIVAAADCTGHGVPGAFMSMIGNTLLNQIVNEKGCTQPSTILEQLHLGVVKSLGQDDDPKGAQDGMEMGVCCIDYEKEKLEFAGAKNPLYAVYDNELEIIKADKKPIGGRPIFDEVDSERSFTNKVLPLKKGMSIYMFSDGYADQKGGPKGKKFFYKPFQNLLVENQALSMKQQSQVLENNILDWMGESEQLDDMLVVGVKL